MHQSNRADQLRKSIWGHIMIKRLIAAALVVVGTNAWTYAYTRHHITDTLLTEIESITWDFLEDHNLYPGSSNVGVDVAVETQLESRALIGRIYATGGMYHWYNDALRFYGLGALLIAIGLLLPFAKQSKSSNRQPTTD